MFKTIGYASTILVASMALLYMPFAVDLGFGLVNHQVQNLQYALMDLIVGESYSVPAQEHLESMGEAPYLGLGWLVGQHAMINGFALGLAAIQILKRPLRVPLSWHRKLGMVYSLFFFVGISLSSAYLVGQGPETTFSGPIFYYALWLLTAASLVTYGLGMMAIKRKELEKHHYWMRYHFAWMFSAPLLRILWSLCGLIFGGDLVTNNVATVAMSPILISGTMAVVLIFKAPLRKILALPAFKEREKKHLIGYAAVFILGLLGFASWADGQRHLTPQLIPAAWGLFLVLFILIAGFYRQAYKSEECLKMVSAGFYLRYFALCPALIVIGIPLHQPFFVTSELACVGSMVTTWGAGFLVCSYMIWRQQARVLQSR